MPLQWSPCQSQAGSPGPPSGPMPFWATYQGAASRPALCFAGRPSCFSSLSPSRLLRLPTNNSTTLASNLPHHHTSMTEAPSDKAPHTDRIRSWVRTHAYGGSKAPARPTPDHEDHRTSSHRSSSSSSSRAAADHHRHPPLNAPGPAQNAQADHHAGARADGARAPNPEPPVPDAADAADAADAEPEKAGSDSGNAARPPDHASEAAGAGAVVTTGDDDDKANHHNIFLRFGLTAKKILLHSYVNVLLVFVPAGIAVGEIAGMPPGAVFGINAVAIIPLAALLSHATESVARRLGDTIGALLNVTFGNAVELIIL